MSNILILMTALVPTSGHRDLIQWAALMPKSNVKVLIQTRSFEPVSEELRMGTFREEFREFPNVSFTAHENDAAPQNPEDHPDFWGWWRDEINRMEPALAGRWTHVVASEPYGAQVAKVLKAKFMPYDISRQRNEARGKNVRRDPFSNWENILPAFRQKMMLKAVMFGPESVGKTTVAKGLGQLSGFSWEHEYARPYLKTVGPQCGENEMEGIHWGQYALQRKVYREAASPITVFDTDLYSTLGYYGFHPEMQISADLAIHANETRGDIYYLLPDEIPFEPDSIRYGNGKRESTSAYWETVLKQHNLPYVWVPEGTVEEKMKFVSKDILQRWQARWDPIADFRRE